MVKKKKTEINLNPQKKSPRISRAIPEAVLSFVRDEKYVLLASLSGIFFFCLMLYAIVLLSGSLQTKKNVEAQKNTVMREKVFWEAVTKERPAYRDGYFMLALVEYRLGKKQEAQKHVEKALEIDPNFKEGRELENLLESNSD